MTEVYVCTNCGTALPPLPPPKSRELTELAARSFLRWLERRYPGKRWVRVELCGDCEARRGVNGLDGIESVNGLD